MGAIQSYNSYDSTIISENEARSTSQVNGITKIMSGLAEIGMTGIEPEHLPRLLPSDRMEPALVIMAEVRAYFQGNCVFNLFIFKFKNVGDFLLMKLLSFSCLQTFRRQHTSRDRC